MANKSQIIGRLVSLNWPKSGTEATLAFDTTQLQAAKAEIEDAEGITHVLDVHVSWDADYLVGKEVCTGHVEDGVTLLEHSS